MSSPGMAHERAPPTPCWAVDVGQGSLRAHHLHKRCYSDDAFLASAGCGKLASDILRGSAVAAFL